MPTWYFLFSFLFCKNIKIQQMLYPRIKTIIFWFQFFAFCIFCIVCWWLVWISMDGCLADWLFACQFGGHIVCVTHMLFLKTISLLRQQKHMKLTITKINTIRKKTQKQNKLAWNLKTIFKITLCKKYTYIIII